MFKFIDKKKIIILASAAVFVVIIVVASFKFYPIAFVGGKPVIYSDFDKDYNAAIIYYQKAVTTYNNGNADVMNSSEIRSEIKRAGLEAAIEDVLISNELIKRLGSSEAQAQIKKNVDPAISGKDIEKEIEELYGLSTGEFVKRFLEPQARREILEARLRLENALPNDNFNEWLVNAKKQAKVMIFLPGFEWKDGTVIIKK